MKALTIGIVALALCSCTYPTSSIDQGSEPGHLRFSDSPIGAQVSIDGQFRGARTDAAPLMFDVPPGKHTIEEVANGQVLFHREYDVGAGSTLEIRTVN
jgi:hypothetical protein